MLTHAHAHSHTHTYHKYAPFCAIEKCCNTLKLLRHTSTNSRRCNTLLYTATRWSTLQHTDACAYTHAHACHRHALYLLLLTSGAPHCNTLLRTATRQYTRSAIDKGHTTLQHAAAHCNTPMHTHTHALPLTSDTPHCNTLLHTAAHQ